MQTTARVLLSFVVTISACDHARSPQNEDERLLYMMGQAHGETLAYLQLNEHELALFTQGLKDKVLKKTPSEPALNYHDYGPNLERYQDRRLARLAEKEKQEGKTLANALAKQGGKTLSNGLTYKILALGNEKRALDHETVELHFHQTLRNKEVIYSTLDNGKKELFKVRDLVPGLRAALQLVGEGGELQLVLPSDLAYGDRGLPPAIPGGASVSSYMKLFRITQ